MPLPNEGVIGRSRELNTKKEHMKDYKLSEVIIGVSKTAIYLNRTNSMVYKWIQMGKLNPIQEYRQPLLFDLLEVNKLKKTLS